MLAHLMELVGWVSLYGLHVFMHHLHLSGLQQLLLR
jgi:hypothetical protein